jgi:hypothetical protein
VDTTCVRRLVLGAVVGLAAMLGSLGAPATGPARAAVLNQDGADAFGSRYLALAQPRARDFTVNFSDCQDHGTRGAGTQIVNASVWGIMGGCHVRFLTGGQSWLTSTFQVDVDPRTDGPWDLGLIHLSSSPDGRNPGYSPVRVTLNDREVWRGQPAGGACPEMSGFTWSCDGAEVTASLRRGTNTLRWEFLHGATTHYWLKAFGIIYLGENY